MNAPKYDLGADINKGFQRGDNFVPTTTIENPGVDLSSNAYLKNAWAGAASTAATLATGLGKAAYSALRAGSAAPNAAVHSVLENVGRDVSFASEAPASGALAAKSAFANAGAKTLGAVAAVQGGLESVKNADEFGRSPYSQQDFLNAAARDSEGRYVGIDEAGARKTLGDFNDAGMINSISSGVKFAGGLGALTANPLITAITSVLGGIGGAVVGLVNRGKANRKFNEIMGNVRSAVAGYNDQLDSELESNRVLSDFYSRHGADAGKSTKDSSGIGLMGGHETKVETDENGRVIDAWTAPVTDYTPYRVDNIPFEDTEHTFVVGNKFDKRTGTTFADKGEVYANMFNSGNPALMAIGEKGLLKALKDQAKTPDNNPNPYEADLGKNMKKIRKYDNAEGRYTGFDALKASRALNIIPGILGALGGLQSAFTAKAMPTEAPVAPVDDYSAMQAINSMPTTINIKPQLNTINDQTRHARYAIQNSGSLSAGQKLAALSQLTNNNMRAISDVYGKYYSGIDTLLGNKAAAWLNMANSYSARKQQAAQEQINNRMKANAAKYNNIAAGWKNTLTPIYDMFKNANNNNWMLANIGLYEQQLKNNTIADLARAGWSNEQIKDLFKSK